MPLYLWICDCGEEIEHRAPIEDRDIAPEKCPKCGSKMLKREHFQRPTAGAKGFILSSNGTGFHNDNYTKYRSTK